ncbi:MAG: peptide chain release factor N(5)-glutamine methyltransferase [Chloroflexota bacterium]
MHSDSNMPESATSRTIRSLRAEVRGRLAACSDTPGLDADLLIGQVLDMDRPALLIHDERAVSDEEERAIHELALRRMAGEPVAYIVGRKSFRGVDLIVDPQVLVPRPETEEMVDFAHRWLREHSPPARILDLGTGSGAIALALASELGVRAGVEIVGSDVSDGALDVARRNRAALGLENQVELYRSDLFTDLDGAFDVVLANLPYLRNDQCHPSTRMEPDLALYAGEDGLALYRRLLDELNSRVTGRGMAVLEIDPDQRVTLIDIMAGIEGWTARIEADLAGLDRYLVLHRR